MYEVLITFTDLEDKEQNTVYIAGKDKYPREGLAPLPARISALQSDKNKLGKPVIAKKPTEPPEK